MEEAQALLLKNFRVGKDKQSACAQWPTEMARNPLAPIPFREVFVTLALFLPQLAFLLDGTSAPLSKNTASSLTSHQQQPVCRPCMNIVLPFPRGRKRQFFALLTFRTSTMSIWQTAPPMQCTWAVRWGKPTDWSCKKATLASLPCATACFHDTATEEKGESPSEKLRRMSSPRTWNVALVPFWRILLLHLAETGLACPVSWAFPPSFCILESKPTKFRALATAEAGYS